METGNSSTRRIVFMKKIIHVALWQLKSEATKEEVDKLTKYVFSFKETIPGIHELYMGPLAFFDFPEEVTKVYGVSSDSRWVARGYTHELYVTFLDEASRKNYDSAKPHLELSSILMPLLKDGVNSLLTTDLVIP